MLAFHHCSPNNPFFNTAYYSLLTGLHHTLLITCVWATKRERSAILHLQKWPRKGMHTLVCIAHRPTKVLLLVRELHWTFCTIVVIILYSRNSILLVIVTLTSAFLMQWAHFQALPFEAFFQASFWRLLFSLDVGNKGMSLSTAAISKAPTHTKELARTPFFSNRHVPATWGMVM